MIAWLAANKLILAIVLGIALIAGGWYTVHHLKQVGVAQQQALDAKAEVAQTAKVQAAQAVASTANANASATLQIALAAPVLPGIVVRVCQPAALHIGNNVSASPSPGPAGARSTGLPSPVVGAASVAQGPDIAPGTLKILADATAELEFWHAYYKSCVAVGACK